ncbi:DMT family transporter [Parendozoicomonas haliclonae]|uniref:Putative inner membrane transporter yiJE n=1 Tax=Parendozoicomonas haliclonae TaxID=1960125 RepID=A0A1X7AKK0_9GAMM|nr:DMT family transporter [Parendozoicomonas haliclonae]SMA47123.1 putative inner membrane transporter yiJE [Parendozoicomonas haliclonae]
MKEQRLALLNLHIAIVLLGISGLFGKLLPIDPTLIVLGRTVIGAAVLAGILLFQKRLQQAFAGGWSLSKAQWPLNMLLGIVLALHWITFFKAIQVSSVAIGLLAFASFPVFVTLLEPLLFREKLRLLDLLTAAGVVLGLFIIFPLSSMDSQADKVAGIAWGVVSALLFALLSLANRFRIQNTDAVTLTCQQNIGAALITLLLIPAGGLSIMANHWPLLLALGLLCTTLPMLMFLNSLRHLKAQLVSLVTCLEPVYGIVFAAALFGDVPSSNTLIGGAVILLAITAGTLIRNKSRSFS